MTLFFLLFYFTFSPSPPFSANVDLLLPLTSDGHTPAKKDAQPLKTTNSFSHSLSLSVFHVISLSLSLSLSIIFFNPKLVYCYSSPLSLPTAIATMALAEKFIQ